MLTNSTNFVNAGDTIQQVIQQCGPPQKVVNVKTEAAIWTYTIVQFGNVAHIGFSLWFNGNAVSKITMTQDTPGTPGTSSAPGTPGTLSTPGTQGTRNIQRTSIDCPRGIIQVGSTTAQVVAACGQPTTTQNLTPQLQQQTGKITHLIYQPQSYLPVTTFIFKNGVLVGTE